MARTETFRVVGGRVHFKCNACQGKRMLAIAPEVRRRSIRCHRCGEITHCNFNRRLLQREQQRGKVQVMLVGDAEFIVAELYDISLYGIGFNVAFKDLRKISVGRAIRFRCPWNPRLLSEGSYVVRSIKGQRIGAQQENKF